MGNSLEADDQSCRLRVNIRNVLKKVLAHYKAMCISGSDVIVDC